MKYFSFLAIVATGSLLVLSGCATIMSGTSQDLTFISNPDGAEVTVGGRVIGRTPITTRLGKESGQTLQFAKEGYEPVSMHLDTHLDGWFWGNIILGGFFGSTTDGVTGAVNEYSPSQYMVTLTPVGTMRQEEQSSLSRNQKAKDFIVVSYQELLKDIQKGEGQYLSSLFQLLGIKPLEQGEALKKIRALSEVYTVIPDFADHVVDFYHDSSSNPSLSSSGMEGNSGTIKDGSKK